MGRHRPREWKQNGDEALLREAQRIAADIGREHQGTVSVLLEPTKRAGVWTLHVCVLPGEGYADRPSLATYTRTWPRSEPESLAAALHNAVENVYWLLPHTSELPNL